MSPRLERRIWASGAHGGYPMLVLLAVARAATEAGRVTTDAAVIAGRVGLRPEDVIEVCEGLIGGALVVSSWDAFAAGESSMLSLVGERL